MNNSINDNQAGLLEAQADAQAVGLADLADAVTAEQEKTLLNDESGATTLEVALLLACIAFPSYFILDAALSMLVDYYRMTMTLLALPLP